MPKKQDDIKEPRSKIVRKSFALTKDDLKNIELIKDHCLDKKIVLSDSQVVRMSIKLTAKLKDKELIELSQETPKNPTGRPKKIR